MEAGRVLRGGDEQVFADAAQHEGGQGIEDEGLVIDGQELLARHRGQRIESRAAQARRAYTIAQVYQVRRGVGWFPLKSSFSGKDLKIGIPPRP